MVKYLINEIANIILKTVSVRLMILFRRGSGSAACDAERIEYGVNNMKRLVTALLVFIPLILSADVTHFNEMARNGERLVRESKKDLIITFPPTYNRHQLKWLAKSGSEVDPDKQSRSVSKIRENIAKDIVISLRRHRALLASGENSVEIELRKAYASYLPPHASAHDTLRRLHFCGFIENVPLREFIEQLNNEMTAIGFTGSLFILDATNVENNSESDIYDNIGFFKGFYRARDKSNPRMSVIFMMISGVDLLDIINEITQWDWAITDNTVIISSPF